MFDEDRDLVFQPVYRTDKTPAPPAEAFRFLADAANLPAAGRGSLTRNLEGVAYSGRPITGHWYWGNVAFDLSTHQQSPSAAADVAQLGEHLRLTDRRF